MAFWGMTMYRDTSMDHVNCDIITKLDLITDFDLIFRERSFWGREVVKITDSRHKQRALPMACSGCWSFKDLKQDKAKF